MLAFFGLDFKISQKTWWRSYSTWWRSNSIECYIYSLNIWRNTCYFFFLSVLSFFSTDLSVLHYFSYLASTEANVGTNMTWRNDSFTSIISNLMFFCYDLDVWSFVRFCLFFSVFLLIQGVFMSLFTCLTVLY